MRRPCRPDEVRVVGVGEPVRCRRGRTHHGVLVDGERGVARTGEREQVGDRLRAAGGRSRIPGPLADTELDSLGRRDPGEIGRSRQVGAAQLEIDRPGAGDCAGSEKGAPGRGKKLRQKYLNPAKFSAFLSRSRMSWVVERLLKPSMA